MRKSLKKAEVWLYTFISLLFLYMSTLLLAPEQIGLLGPSVIYALVGLSGLYGAVNVADNGVKGKFPLRGNECGQDIQL